jgi:hypothetical protein
LPDFKGQLIRWKIPGKLNYRAEANATAYPALTQLWTETREIPEVLEIIGAP